MIEIYEKFKCSIVAIQEVPRKETNKYGIISGDLIDNSKGIYRVNDMVEKPLINKAPSNLAIIGRYILTPDIFDILREINPDKNREIQITEALRIQAKLGNVIAYKFKGDRFDCGSVEGYVSATNHFAKKIGIKTT